MIHILELDDLPRPGAVHKRSGDAHRLSPGLSTAVDSLA
jgi:hypothetical protein